MILFRLGTTSYILPDDILPNVRYLADKVEDIELILFEADEKSAGNLPTPDVISELTDLAAKHNLTYTVHLPLDLRLGADSDQRRASLAKARRVMDLTHDLKPWAYVIHLNAEDTVDYKDWVERVSQALRLAAEWAGGEELLAVENLEGYQLDFNQPVVERIGVSRCVDIGHLWLDGHDALPYLQMALPRTRVIHLHGIGTRDHQSLNHMEDSQVRTVLECLVRQNYSGIVTLEVFNQEDLISSLQVVKRLMRGLWERG